MSKYQKIGGKNGIVVTENWTGGSAISRKVVIYLIGNSNTKKDLKIKSVLDKNKYEKAKIVNDEKLSTINLKECKFYGRWNYFILPIECDHNDS